MVLSSCSHIRSPHAREAVSHMTTHRPSHFRWLTSGSAITISIFFSASTANSANRLLMTYSPGLSSGSMVMLDMAAAALCFSHERGVTEEGARRLLTLLLLTGGEAEDREHIFNISNYELSESP